jgi:hypothetical protein
VYVDLTHIVSFNCFYKIGARSDFAEALVSSGRKSDALAQLQLVHQASPDEPFLEKIGDLQLALNDTSEAKPNMKLPPAQPRIPKHAAESNASWPGWKGGKRKSHYAHSWNCLSNHDRPVY